MVRATRYLLVSLLVPLLVLAPLAASVPSGAADLHAPARRGFLATCEDLGRLCTAEGCGADQIEAERDCRRGCPSSVTMAVVPGSCPLPGAVLRRRG